MRLMSHCAMPRMPPVTIVIAPTTATISCAAGERSKSGAKRATRYTPAVTIVAAWISAETGVGPSMASGSHVCNGTCADFAAAAMKSVRQMTKSGPLSSEPARAKTSAYAIDPVAAKIAKIAYIRPMSPTTLITNALRDAATAVGL